MQRRTWMQHGVATLAGMAVLGAPRAKAAGFTETEAAAGVRAALERGALVAVAQLGQTDGFLGNPKVRIPLPGFLKGAGKILEYAGQQGRVDELEIAMNRAAEAAMPRARTLLVEAVRSISVEDAQQLIRGGDDAVTRFFAAKTREPLKVSFLPVVTEATKKVSLADKYNEVAGKAAGMGLVKKEDANIEDYVTSKALDGLYAMIAEQERNIRKDPVGTGSAILKQVFGTLK